MNNIFSTTNYNNKMHIKLFRYILFSTFIIPRMIKSLSTKVFLGSDHAGFDYKEMLKAHLVGKGYECQDMGTYSKESVTIRNLHIV